MRQPRASVFFFHRRKFGQPDVDQLKYQWRAMDAEWTSARSQP